MYLHFAYIVFFRIKGKKILNTYKTEAKTYLLYLTINY